MVVLLVFLFLFSRSEGKGCVLSPVGYRGTRGDGRGEGLRLEAFVFSKICGMVIGDGDFGFM